MFKLLLISLIGVLLTFDLHAQTISRDSLVNSAFADIKKFKLNKQQFKEFKKNKSNSYSDLFKPTEASVSNIGFLADSVYVNAFRNAAYQKTLKRRTTGHYFLVGGVAYVVVVAVATVVVLLVLLAKATK